VATPLFTKTKIKNDLEINRGSPRHRATPQGCDNDDDDDEKKKEKLFMKT
jgi:hypothetical protein